MKDFTSRSPCFTVTHSRCRGDFSSRSLAASWAAATPAEASAISIKAGRCRMGSSLSWMVLNHGGIVTLPRDDRHAERDGYLNGATAPGALSLVSADASGQKRRNAGARLLEHGPSGSYAPPGRETDRSTRTVAGDLLST